MIMPAAAIKHPNRISNSSKQDGHLFKPDYDEDLYMCRSLIQDYQRTTGASWTGIARRASLSYGCIKNIMEGVTRKPQNATINMLRRVFGVKRILVDANFDEKTLGRNLISALRK
jgi:hypothetical protein